MPLKTVFGRKTPIFPSRTELDSEQLRLNAAMAYIRKCGTLDTYPGEAGERRALLTTAVRRGLVAWDRRRERYELTGPGKAQLAVSIPNAASSGESARIPASGTAPESRAVTKAHLGQHQPAADAKRRRGAKITPIAAITVLAACGGITAGVYLGPVEVKVPVNWQIGANALPDSSAASRGDTTATAAAAISVGQQGVATEPGSAANATVTAADTKSPESAALGPAPPSSRDVEPAHRRSRAEGAAHSVALRLTTDDGPRHKAKQKHHRHYYARHNRGYRSQFASEGPQGDTPPGWYWEPQY